MAIDVFSTCHQINDHLLSGDESSARNELIKLLAALEEDGLPYSPLVNSLIRIVGLFPYLDPATSTWQDRYVREVFKVDVGAVEPVTLHREQRRLLTSLLSGKSIAVSAPTGFGKSFVIDSFIAIKKPATVVILVPTIALADETRRRLQRKFGDVYKVITAPDQSLSELNILVFPQERSVGYVDKLSYIDLLIVDEFYKASASFDKERSPSLIRAILALGMISSQRYFLAPNISELKKSPFTEGMEFLHLDFNTVFLEKSDLTPSIGNNEQKKSEILLGILDTNPGKTLIYAGTYTNIEKLANLLMTNLDRLERPLLGSFQTWLSRNYDPNWALAKLVLKGVGVHNGRLHRSLSQIQVKLFEERDGLDRMISTSSIIEGVNTSAQNIVLWSNRSGNVKIDDFTYKNIIGRGGRMFKHFVGKIFILEKPPTEIPTQLELEMPDELLGVFDEETTGIALTTQQMAKIAEYQAKIEEIIGSENWNDFRRNAVFQTSSSSLIVRIATEVRDNKSGLRGLGYLNSSDPEQWDSSLYMLINLQPGGWGIEYSKYVAFVKILSKNWELTIPELLDELSEYDIGVDRFFELERNTAFKLASILGDVATMYNRVNSGSPIDLTRAISKFSHAFLPTVVYQLEEYGLPRMISRKLHLAGIFDFENTDNDVHGIIDSFRRLGLEKVSKLVGELDEFDMYILRYFYDGIVPD